MAERAADDAIIRKARAGDGQRANPIDQAQIRHDVLAELNAGCTRFGVLTRNQRE
jgi:hypothetical protein